MQLTHSGVCLIANDRALGPFLLLQAKSEEGNTHEEEEEERVMATPDILGAGEQRHRRGEKPAAQAHAHTQADQEDDGGMLVTQPAKLGQAMRSGVHHSSQPEEENTGPHSQGPNLSDSFSYAQRLSGTPFSSSLGSSEGDAKAGPGSQVRVS